MSQLLDDAGNVKASYGYTAYGATDAPFADTESLTSGDPDPQAPINPYRYASRRIDSGTVPSTTPTVPAGSGGYDMGARRFGPDLGAFLQQDQFDGALSDLGLATDPLTQNRYALAGGNPVSYVEWDGHAPTADNPVSANPTLNVQLNSTPAPPPTSVAGPSAGSYAATREAGAGLSSAGSGSTSAASEFGRLRPGGTPTAGLAPIPIAVGVGSRLAAVGIAALGILAGGLLLCGDTPQCANQADPDKHIKKDVKQDPEEDCLSGGTKSPPTYSELDSLHRPGPATACLVAPLTRGPELGNPQVEGLIRGTHVRGHLIGRQFGGSGRRENLVPMYPKANNPWMELHEEIVRAKVDAGMRVWYEVSPVYAGDRPVPTSIRMRAVGRMPDWAPGQLWQMTVSIRNEEQGGILIGP